MTLASVTWTSYPCSLSVGVTTPLTSKLDSIKADAISSKVPSPTLSLFTTHCRVPVESRRTTNLMALDPLDLCTHPFRCTSSLSSEPSRTSPIHTDFTGYPRCSGWSPTVSTLRSVGGSDGVRTRGLRVKSPSLYLTKLQTRLWVRGFLFNYSDWSSQSSAVFHQCLNPVLSS